MYAIRLKRLLDLTGACVLLALLAPLAAVTALIVLFTMGRPVLFRQRRPGLGGRAFTILKFRTLLPDCDAAGLPLSDGERVHSAGLLLRALSLDELPQLVNILKGEMSFVGPRPLLERYLPFYTARERLRHSVRPGLTGWAQVQGRNDVEWDRRLDLDAWYAEHVSFGLDARIVLRTIRTLIKREGVRENPGTVMSALDEERAFRQSAFKEKTA